MAEFSTEDFLVVDLVHREQQVPRYLKSRVGYLIGQGVIERMGRGRGTRHILSRAFYAHMKTKGSYTRRKGLDYNTNKALLLQHLTENIHAGCPIAELEQVIPSLSRRAIQRLLGELRSEGKARLAGSKRAARWWIA
jgi:ATP-dependent DNA helicase RecG